jgi:selenide,water dikinase
MVDDPYWFGQIAAANALSDVYAMGGEPKTAMNLVCFPLKQMDLSVLRQVIQGGIDKVREAEWCCWADTAWRMRNSNTDFQ